MTLIITGDRKMNYSIEDEDVVTSDYIDYWMNTAWE